MGSSHGANSRHGYGHDGRRGARRVGESHANRNGRYPNRASDADGGYVLTNLPTGPYNLEISKAGFTTTVQTGIVLQVNSDPAVPVALKIGAVSERVNVEANATQVETRSVGVGTVMETQRILELPLNGRQATDLITANGAAVQTGVSRGFGMRTGALISVAGGNTNGVQYTMDGAQHLNFFDGTNMPLPFPDALQEFKISTSTQEAASGGHSAASVSAVMKSGTNAFHGDIFEFLRNTAVNGRDYFQIGQDGLKRNQFGGVIGGPIKKDKLFFFMGYQGTTVRVTPIASQVIVPTAAIPPPKRIAVFPSPIGSHASRWAITRYWAQDSGSGTSPFRDSSGSPRARGSKFEARRSTPLTVSGLAIHN